ncbi:DnaT-like ssDNA-binding domain-containing protein [Pantoea eucalypti]|uniref:DnaT-like ssDNA-binding domain-containing protein n=1 Tax=Pantoea eucalypti TaxID=470933 RepID=UPI00289F80A9|nr:DnaT-like ssDNA-binding domain-containing protein [Pantoea eucalypti]
MDGNWLKMSASLKTHPKVNEIAALLESPPDGGAEVDVTVGGQRSALLTRNVTRCITVTALLSIWGAAKEYASNGVFRNVDLSYLDVLAEFSGFGEAMAAVGWAVYDANEHCVILKTDNDDGVVVASKKSSAAERQRRYRERKRAQKSVTQGVTRDVTRYASGITQTVTRDARFSFLKSKTTHKNQNNTHIAREISSLSVDNSEPARPQALVSQGLRPVQPHQAEVLPQPMQQQTDPERGVTRYVTQSVTPMHNATVTQRNASALMQRNASGVTQRYAASDISLTRVRHTANASDASERVEEKFVMFNGWQPSATFTETASRIGIRNSAAPDRLQLADFVNYWIAEGVTHYQEQWEMKLARYLEKGRTKPSIKRTGGRRDCTMVTGMDYAIPEGFRGG